MRNNAVRSWTIVAALMFSLSIPTETVFAAGVGSSCTKIGTLSGTAKKPLICKKIGKKLVWTRSKTVPGALSSPTTATFIGGGINIVWSVPVSNGQSPVTGFKMSFQTTKTPWLSVSEIFSAQTNSTFIKQDELAGATYRFRIAAINAVGIGPYSESNWIEYPSSAVSATPTTTVKSITTVAPTATAGTTTTTTAATTTTTTTTLPAGSVSQRNAVSTGASYLRSSSFSRSGLISQLQYEGFSLEDATYGTDAQNANWNTQAVKSGASYLRSSSFSRSGLISQLQFEGFSGSEATYGTDSQNADWNTQAAKTAASYLRSSSFSRSGLISQLLFEGFTQAQADYGVGTTGL
jgi:hypothetical protein